MKSIISFVDLALVLCTKTLLQTWIVIFSVPFGQGGMTAFFSSRL